jgi:hypothetical protein
VDWTRAGDKTHETSAPSPCRFREVVSWSAPMHSSGLQSRLLGFDSGRGGLARFGVARRGRLLPVSTAGSVRSVGARVTSWRVPSLVQIGRGQRAVGHVLPFRGFPAAFQPALDVCGGVAATRWRTELIRNRRCAFSEPAFASLSLFFSFFPVRKSHMATWARTTDVERNYFTVPSLDGGKFLDSFPLGNRFLTLVY